MSRDHSDETDVIRTRLGHMLEAVELIDRFLGDRTADDIREDLQTLHAIRSAFMQLGEAANRVPESYRRAHRDIPWDEIRKYRNFIVHAIMVDPLWETAANHVPKLREPLARLLADVSQEGDD